MKSALRVLVRYGFSDENIWRDALGNTAQLFVCSIDGPLDAPEHMPAGAMKSCGTYPSRQQTAGRE